MVFLYICDIHRPMLNAKDLELLAAKGISEKQIEEQLACFVKGFPFLEITASASVERGIMVIPQEKQAPYMDAWDAYLAKNKKILKFVPASGAASRMFKNLYSCLPTITSLRMRLRRSFLMTSGSLPSMMP